MGVNRACSLARAGALAVALATASVSSTGFAQSKAAAEALFDHAQQLMRKGDFAAACTKLEESQRLDPGIGTLLYLGECYEKVGRTASAWATFREAASAARAAGQTRREKAADERARALDPVLSRLTITVPAQARVEGLELRRDGVVIDPAVFGVPIPVDPGERRIEATAPGRKPWSQVLTVAAGSAQATLDVPVLEPAEPPPAPIAAPEPKPAPAPAPVTAAPPPPSEAPPDATADAQSGAGQRTMGLVLAGAGAVGVGIGSFFGLRAIDRNAEAEKHCPRGNRCDTRDGVELTDEAKDAASVSTIAFGLGLAALAGGIVIFATAPSANAPTSGLAVRVAGAPGFGSVRLGGTF